MEQTENGQPQIQYAGKISFKKEDRIKTFQIQENSEAEGKCQKETDFQIEMINI